MSPSLALCCAATALALISVGGGLYEFLVVDPCWPRRPDLVQPAQGGISRRRFWIPAHVAFELMLMVALAVSWPVPGTRTWLLAALVCHAAMRVWSALDFIPRALAVERNDPAAIAPGAALAWTRRSRLRLPLDLATCTCLVLAVASAAGIA